MRNLSTTINEFSKNIKKYCNKNVSTHKSLFWKRTYSIGCFKINNFEKLKFLQILEFCQLFSTSSFSFYAVSVTKSYPMHKIKCVGNEILLHLKYFKVLKRGFLTKLGGLTWPLNEKVKISFFDERLGHLDG